MLTAGVKPEPMDNNNDHGTDPIAGVSDTNEQDEEQDEETNETDGNGNELQNELQTEMDTKYGPRTTEWNMRPRRAPDYEHLMMNRDTTLVHTVLSQYTMKKGIQKFGTAGVDAVLRELKQLHDRKVMIPKTGSSMSREEKRASLRYLMFLKKKRCGRIKGRGCADGRKQREHTPKEDASSPTVAIESLMLSCAIDAMEGQDVATVDIPGAFMQADMDKLVC